MRQHMKAILRSAGVGHAWTQPAFRGLHRAALFGRNFGEGDFRWSGELAAMRRVHRHQPDARVLFDVGANFGGWALEAAAVWPQATIHCFEPAASVYERLQAATRGLSVVCVPSGLSDTSGGSTLYAAPGHPGLSSVHDRDLSFHGLTMTDRENITLTTLDEYCHASSIDRIDLLKIDVEGHDLAVLQGGRKMLEARKVGAIQFEFGGANIDSRTYLRDFVTLLAPNYRLHRIVAGGIEPLRYSEKEEVFVTTNFLAELAD
jgi:FkbM family methyltransferase